MRRIALFVLFAILSGTVNAYPATSGCNYQAAGPVACSSSPHASAAAAGACIAANSRPGDAFVCWSANTAPVCAGGTTPDCAVPGSVGYAVTFDGGSYVANHAVTAVSSGYSCPNGGTLSGSTCTCGAGQTDTGTSCTTPACPAGQHLVTGTCVPICPGAGRAWNPLDSGDPSTAELTYPSGQISVCADVAFIGDSGPVSDKCRVIPTGSLIVCADIGGGGGVICGSETGRYTGARCTTASDLPAETTTTCDTGDLWCKNPSGGPCASGFMGASFNGQNLCVKIGEPVNAVPQPQSPIAPPLPGDVTSPPTHSDPPTQTGETPNPNQRTVVGVGGGATAGNGSGGNGNGNGTGDAITCGLPDTPKCKIDEAGTPTGTGVFDSVNTAAQAVEDAIKGMATTVVGDKGSTGWGFSLSLPSGCTNPPTISWPFAHISWTADLCQHQSNIHLVTGFLWAFLTLVSIVGMIRRTITGG